MKKLLLLSIFAFVLAGCAQEEMDVVVDGDTDVITDEVGDATLTLEEPSDGDTVTSPLQISGMARGSWFFEGSFPVSLTNWDGLIIIEGYVELADGEETWMTEEFVGFEGELEFENPSWEEEFSKRGSLILQKANPSGMVENDEAYEITVWFE